jgi:hypothetical protein
MIINKLTLQERATLLFKDNERMQQKWIEAVEKTRQTKRGWLLDKQVERIDTQKQS